MSDDIETMARQLDELQEAQNAVQRYRERRLAEAIDCLAVRVRDCTMLIEAGTIDYQHAFETMIKPQTERIVEALRVFQDKASLPSVIEGVRASRRSLPLPKSDRPNPAS